MLTATLFKIVVKGYYLWPAPAGNVITQNRSNAFNNKALTNPQKRTAVEDSVNTIHPSGFTFATRQKKLFTCYCEKNIRLTSELESDGRSFTSTATNTVILIDG